MLNGPAGAHLPPPPTLPGRSYAVIVARFNGDLTGTMRDRCVATLEDSGAERIDVYEVPGAWELPQTAARVGALERHDAIVTIGCVIRGETAHFDFVAGEASDGLGVVARSLSVPLIFGVLTTDTVEQAWERAGPEHGDKGREFAISALHMVSLYEDLA